ncbi:carboxyvinyl-carboxyphosphonate phosphorylmutase [Pseudomonas duriflava]|uniref:Carboxyvinyl-carboxyphosphonate phosphorylmutase n=1 Tax=Pseudomonas duriflava TaxID=459528 RepID=A0A562PPJ4_9PSED|nr:carboxyvinyl-carboxyphosphonate phosphorylmutase [Pseudomonas duriflava]
MTFKLHHDLRKAFDRLLYANSCKLAASVFDPMSVCMAENLGFEVAILGGSVASLQMLGALDISLMSLSELAEQACRVGREAQIPVIADADHGYGNALNVMRTVVELQNAGVAALTLEDTHLPAQYNERSPVLITFEETVKKIHAARAARSDDALTIIARTNAVITFLNECVARTAAYQKAGADAICFVCIALKLIGASIGDMLF